MTQSFEQSILISAPASAVWESMTEARLMQEWMGDPEMAVRVETDWTVGGAVVVRGFHHVPFENTGTVLAFEPGKQLAYTHLSSLSRLPDEPASYTTLAFTAWWRPAFRRMPSSGTCSSTGAARWHASPSVWSGVHRPTRPCRRVVRCW